VADLLFQNLARTANPLDSTPLRTVSDVYDPIWANQLLLPPATQDSLDRLDWNAGGSDLEASVPDIQEGLTTRAGRRQRSATPAVIPSVVPAMTVHPAALDQAFAKVHECDVILDDE
jgi:hypothetical protein